MFDDADTEDLIEACLEALEEGPDEFNAWERGFLEGVEEANEQGHLSEAQFEKLREVAEEHDIYL